MHYLIVYFCFIANAINVHVEFFEKQNTRVNILKMWNGTKSDVEHTYDCKSCL